MSKDMGDDYFRTSSTSSFFGSRSLSPPSISKFPKALFLSPGICLTSVALFAKLSKGSIRQIEVGRKEGLVQRRPHRSIDHSKYRRLS